MSTLDCNLLAQGLQPGRCSVSTDGKPDLACLATLRRRNGTLERLVHSVHLSRPENYLSIYQSGCNMRCRKCHSWEFTQHAKGQWMSPEDICERAVAYEEHVTVTERREKATAWHASETCRCCGSCVLYGRRSPSCPSVLRPESVVLSAQGFGPARNIVAFTGGDLTCCPEFYGECAKRIKAKTKLWVLIETNGYGLTTRNLDYLEDCGVDGFWLDIKAFDNQKHKWLTGCTNETILELPEEILERNFVLEVLSLYIPILVEADELESIARLLVGVDPAVPFTVLAFFPEYMMRDYTTPSVENMVDTYQRIRKVGLENVRLGNVGVFARTEDDQRFLIENLDDTAY